LTVPAVSPDWWRCCVRADVAPPGESIRTSATSHPSALVERRMPTAAELDQAATTRPIVVKRGGHNDVVNSACLTMARITEDTPDPALEAQLLRL
jgi:predicted amidohydrolase YtcJ